ncbi:ThiF family adenylyltransferase [Pantoea sp. Mb-10]|uniref:ThiF family adenylyltransferase n=1 Tax=unclassified Pantoea TaxID=2630326 RepID=UPI001E3B00BB|nr:MULTISPECIES: ThiF family adenylyltransferase [unclassified Pantoea]MCE0490332.1 ThiF family adenylyltransferase [Pantoea sp. Mb-10]MCE0501463.1 ThiF family adenylyltransferase [Pantoea sp. Pb-8]
MSLKLISLNPCLKKLHDEGFEIEVRDGLLLIHSVPYVNSKKEVLRGTLITNLVLNSPDVVGIPNTHQMYFSGEHPCRPDGSILSAIQHSSPNKALANGVTGDHHFSNKPPSGSYENYYHQVTSYVRVIENQAKFIDETISARTFLRHYTSSNDDIFLYQDTASARIGTVQLNDVFSTQKVAIIGMGGTGSYILDMISKTKVKEIHLYDKDHFQQHNAFRAPGAASIDDLNNSISKCDYYHGIYKKLRGGVFPHNEMISEQNVDEILEFDFVFICVDSSQSRKFISTSLMTKNVPFIDVGMGLSFTDDKGSIFGTCRTTLFTERTGVAPLKTLPTESHVEDIYKSNIQLVELNCLNAAFAVIQWKKEFGFYCDDMGSFEMTYSLGINKIANKRTGNEG